MPRTRAGSPASLSDLKLASGVVGGKWKTAILYCLAPGPLRFGALRRAVDGVSEKVLIHQLRQLEEDGLIERQVSGGDRPIAEYSMTKHGLTACDLLEQISAWGAKHRQFAGKRPTAKRGKARSKR
ncbi:MAG: helix-turn-helix domain-containing protein [Myxococcota bacterium]